MNPISRAANVLDRHFLRHNKRVFLACVILIGGFVTLNYVPITARGSKENNLLSRVFHKRWFGEHGMRAFPDKALTPSQEAACKLAFASFPKYWKPDVPYEVETDVVVSDAGSQFVALGEPMIVSFVISYKNQEGDKLRRMFVFTTNGIDKISCRENDESDERTPKERAERNAVLFIKGIIHDAVVLKCTATINDPEWHNSAPISIIVVVRYNDGAMGWTKKIFTFASDTSGRSLQPVSGF